MILQQKLAVIERALTRMISSTAELAYDDTMKQLRDSGIEQEVVNTVSTITKEHFKNISLRNVDGLMKTIEQSFNDYASMLTPPAKTVQVEPSQQKTDTTESDQTKKALLELKKAQEELKAATELFLQSTKTKTPPPAKKKSTPEKVNSPKVAKVFQEEKQMELPTEPPTVKINF